MSDDSSVKKRIPSEESDAKGASQVPLTEQAILQIKHMIQSGELGPGDRLPNEHDLSRRLGLSRNSLREAVRALSTLGVLDVRHGQGTFVTSLEPELLLEGVGLVVDLIQEHTMLELFEVRRLIEPAATALAAARIGPQELGELRECLEGMDRTESTEDLIDRDLRFHEIIVGATQNGTLAALVRSLSSRTIRARVWRSMTDEGAVERSRRWHRLIYDALCAGDGELAHAADHRHLVESEEWLGRVSGGRPKSAYTPPTRRGSGTVEGMDISAEGEGEAFADLVVE